MIKQRTLISGLPIIAAHPLRERQKPFDGPDWLFEVKYLKEAILNTFQGLGGEDWLKKQAEKNPAVFIALLGRVLPLQVHGGHDGPILIVTGIVRPDDGITVRPAPQLGQSTAEPIDVTPSSSKLTH